MAITNKVLIVGGSGYLGRHLTTVLNGAGYTTFYTGTKETGSAGYFQIDFKNPSTFTFLNGQQFDLVLVLASKLNSLGTVSLNHEGLETNTIAYASFLEHLAKNKITSRFIYTSSMTVYGTANSLPVEEDGVIAPVNTYGLSKALAEQITSFYCNHNNVSGAILRLPGIYGGDRQSGYIYNVARKCFAGEKVTLKSDGLIFWETININDLCSIIIRFIKNYHWKPGTNIFNIAYGQETDFYKTAYTIKKLLRANNDIEETGAKGYQPFYLSNKKIKEVVDIREDFHSSLATYLLTVK